jgi:hypothetical protein
MWGAIKLALVEVVKNIKNAVVDKALERVQKITNRRTNRILRQVKLVPENSVVLVMGHNEPDVSAAIFSAGEIDFVSHLLETADRER